MLCDYVIVGSGLYGSVFANELKKAGRKVVVIERQSKVGGNLRTTSCDGVMVHEHGPHIFHTKSKKIWDYVNSFVEFWPYRHRVKARYGDKLYTLPFNMSTYYEMWGCTTPEEAVAELDRQKENIPHPSNLEEQALATIGKDLYQVLVYGYTKKQWQRDPKTLPASIIRRIPLRMDFNNEYYDDWYQGIPIKGYSHLIEQLIDGVDVRLNCEVGLNDWRKLGQKLIYSGSIDELFQCRHGHLEYRGLRFESETLTGDFQGCSQMNYTSESVPYTRIVEHKHFHSSQPEKTIITREYPVEWTPGLTRYYPIDDNKNRDLYNQYHDLVKQERDIIVGGRLGSFKYMDMDTVIGQALTHSKREIDQK